LSTTPKPSDIAAHQIHDDMIKKLKPKHRSRSLPELSNLVLAIYIAAPIAMVSTTASADWVSAVNPVVTTNEDMSVPLGIVVDPSYFFGGAALDVIGTESGFRDAADGTTPVTFTVPAGTQFVRITGMGGDDNGNNNGKLEKQQVVQLTVDLNKQTYSGVSVANAPNGNITYAFQDVPLGASSLSATVDGVTDAGYEVTATLSGTSLTLTDTQSVFDQAYLAEYLTNDTKSSNLTGTAAAVMGNGVASGTLSLPAGTDFAQINVASSLANSHFSHEDKGNGSIYVDFNSMTASGVMYFQFGRGGAYTSAYSFTGYDLTSGDPILSSSATISGDITASGSGLPNPILTVSGSDIIMTRENIFATKSTTMLQGAGYARVALSSPGSSLGSTSASFRLNSGNGNVDTFALPIPIGAQTGNMLIGMTESQIGVATNENENTANASVLIDLVNQTTSGVFSTFRKGDPDLIAWNNVPFGTRLFDGADVTSNHTSLGSFLDQFSGILQFDLITDALGNQSLQGTAAYTQVEANHQTIAQASWEGLLPLVIEATGGGNGTFSAGITDPVTQKTTLKATEIPGLTFTPNLHLSGDNTNLTITTGPEIDYLDVDVIQVADVPTVATIDQTGVVNVASSIVGSVTAGLVDADGSETISAIDLTITVGHTISDGANSFTAATGANTVNVATWNLSALDYLSANTGVFPVAVRVEVLDDDGFSALTDTADNSDTFNVTILVDTDADGIPDTLDRDDDNDGIPDTAEGTGDTDGDGKPDSLDVDSDNDGLTDTLEAGGIDANDDGIIDGFTDNDGDGLDDATAGTPLPLNDTDTDTTPDHLDLDSDNDGLNDIHEAGGTDTDSDGMVDNFTDADGNGLDDNATVSEVDFDSDTIPDHEDIDSDNDGIPDSVEAASGPIDTDGDNSPDHLDLDADDDGISDTDEAGTNPAIPVNTDTDSTADYIDGDSDNDGIPDSVEGNVDSDGDTIPDYLDSDSDGDGISDAIEAGAIPATPVDTDGDGKPDYLDLNSDDDGIADSLELAGDADGDSIPNYLDSDSDDDGIPDGIANYLDLDSDNDGVSDATEGASDTDGDVIPNYLDLDSDNDGIFDIIESGGSDTDGDGVVDGLTDTDNDGLHDGSPGTAGPRICLIWILMATASMMLLSQAAVIPMATAWSMDLPILMAMACTMAALAPTVRTLTLTVLLMCSIPTLITMASPTL